MILLEETQLYVNSRVLEYSVLLACDAVSQVRLFPNIFKDCSAFEMPGTT
jgi:hypothetical protein